MGESTLHRAQAFSMKLPLLRTCTHCSRFFCLEEAGNAEAGHSSMSFSGFLPLSLCLLLLFKAVVPQMLCSGMQCPTTPTVIEAAVCRSHRFPELVAQDL